MSAIKGNYLIVTDCGSPFSSKNIQECRCGADTCRGVLGPRPKEREIKDALKPLTENPGTKRKLQQAMNDVAEAVSNKKRKLAVPKSVKKAIQSVSATAKAQVAKAAAITQSAATKTQAVKKVTARSVRQLSRTKGKGTTVQFRSKTIKGGASAAAATVTARKSGSRGSIIRVESKTVRKNVVRTIKGAQGRGGVGKSIRVIQEA